MRRLIFALLAWSAMQTTVIASPIDNLQLVGSAKLKVLFWDVYQSHLYSASGHYQPELTNKQRYPLALQITYLRDIDADDLLKRTAKEWQGLGLTETEYQAWLVQLAAIWPDIRKNDQLLFAIDAKGQHQFYYNGQAIGQVEQDAFAEQFLAIWLAENASHPKLRQQLIGAN